MSAVMESTLVRVELVIPGGQGTVWEVANWIADALKAEGHEPCHGRPFGRTRRNQNRGYSITWREPAVMCFALLDVSREDAEAAIRRAVQDAPGKVQGVEVNYENERGAHGW